MAKSPVQKYDAYPNLIDRTVRVIKPPIDRLVELPVIGNTMLGTRNVIAKQVFKLLRFRKRELNFYVLSTGCCGTRFFVRILDTATNATVLHQPSPHLTSEMNRIVSIYSRSAAEYQDLTVSDWPELELKLLMAGMVRSPVYGETLNTIYPSAYLLHKYFGPERVRFIHLVRNPLACCRSIMQVERDDGGMAFQHIEHRNLFMVRIQRKKQPIFGLASTK